MSEMQEAVELSEGVALLLQRMKSHPDEFTHNKKWSHVLGVVEERIFNPADRRRAEPWMTDEEVRMIWKGYQRVKQKEFHDFVMKKLLDDGEEEGMSAPLRVNPYMFDPTQLIQPGSVHPGAWVNTTTTQTPDTPLRTAIKRKLGIK
jgi:hypothetical protein